MKIKLSNKIKLSSKSQRQSSFMNGLSKTSYRKALSCLLKSAQSGRQISIDGKLVTEGDIINAGGQEYMILDIVRNLNGRMQAKVMGNDGQETTVFADPKRVTIKGTNIVFEEGDTNWNHRGNYEILAVDDDLRTMRVKYIDGKDAGMEDTLNIATQAQILMNNQQRQNQQMRLRQMDLSGTDEAFTIGYLAASGTINVMIGHENEPRFKKVYNQITGDNFARHLNHNAWIRQSENTDYLRIIFPIPPPDVLNRMTLDEGGVIPLVKGTSAEFNSHNFIRNLFRIGFFIGKNNDDASLSRIRSNVAEKDSFDKGVEYALQPTP